MVTEGDPFCSKSFKKITGACGKSYVEQQLTKSPSPKSAERGTAKAKSRCSPFARPHSVYKWSGIERRGKKTRDGDRKDGSPRIQPTNDAFLLAARVQWLTFRRRTIARLGRICISDAGRNELEMEYVGQSDHYGGQRWLHGPIGEREKDSCVVPEQKK
ncbi:hypothetical protein TNCV_3386631 [Trichonephila clavipes]|nr:hypothetical protein TNCV_3386631 [Trichonephila clavipes]